MVSINFRQNPKNISGTEEPNLEIQKRHGESSAEQEKAQKEIAADEKMKAELIAQLQKLV